MLSVVMLSVVAPEWVGPFCTNIFVQGCKRSSLLRLSVHGIRNDFKISVIVIKLCF
jgi:hypothetical protein